MQIGETIRKYRKERNMTQEEMAKRLGVTPPAVNKWENGNSYPDIMLLAPIARLLDISVDTLLSFRGELTDEEIRQIMSEADEKFKNDSYEEAFAFIRKMLEKYPNLYSLERYEYSDLSYLTFVKGNEIRIYVVNSGNGTAEAGTLGFSAGLALPAQDLPQAQSVPWTDVDANAAAAGKNRLVLQVERQM